MFSRSKTFVRRRLLSHGERPPPRSRAISDRASLEDSLRATVASLEDRLASSDRDGQTLQQENAGLVEELQRLRPLTTQIQQKDIQVSSLEQDLALLRTDLALNRTLAEQRLLELEPLRPLPALLSERDDAIYTLRLSAAELEKTISEQQIELDDARIAAGTQSTALTMLTHELDRLRPLPTLNDDLQQRITRHEAARALLESDLSDSHRETQTALDTIRDRDAELERLRPVAHLLESRVAQISELELNVQLSTRLISALDEQLGRAQEALLAGRERKERQATAAAALNEELESLRPLPALVELLRCDLVAKDAAVGGAEDELRDSQRILHEMSARAADLGVQLGTSHAQVAEHEEHVQRLQTACAAHTQRLQELGCALNETAAHKAHLEAVVSDQHRELEELRPLPARLSEQVSLFNGLRCVLLLAQKLLISRNITIRDQQAANGKLQKQLALDVPVIAGFRAHVNSLEERRMRDLSTVSAQSSELESLRAAVDQQRTVIHDLRQKNESLENRVGDRDRDIAHLRHTVHESEEKEMRNNALAVRYNTAAVRLEAEAREAQERLKVQRERVTKQNKEVFALTDKLRMSVQHAEAQEEEMRALRRDITQRDEALAAQRARNEQLQKELDAAQLRPAVARLLTPDRRVRRL